MEDPDAEEIMERWIKADRKAQNVVIASYLRLTPDAIEAYITGSREPEDPQDDHRPCSQAVLDLATRRELRQFIGELEDELYEKDAFLRAKDVKMFEVREKIRLFSEAFRNRMADMQESVDKIEEEFADAKDCKNDYKASSQASEKENARLRSKAEIKATIEEGLLQTLDKIRERFADKSGKASEPWDTNWEAKSLRFSLQTAQKEISRLRAEAETRKDSNRELWQKLERTREWFAESFRTKNLPPLGEMLRQTEFRPTAETTTAAMRTLTTDVAAPETSRSSVGKIAQGSAAVKAKAQSLPEASPSDGNVPTARSEPTLKRRSVDDTSSSATAAPYLRMRNSREALLTALSRSNSNNDVSKPALKRKSVADTSSAATVSPHLRAERASSLARSSRLGHNSDISGAGSGTSGKSAVP